MSASTRHAVAPQQNSRILAACMAQTWCRGSQNALLCCVACKMLYVSCTGVWSAHACRRDCIERSKLLRWPYRLGLNPEADGNKPNCWNVMVKGKARHPYAVILVKVKKPQVSSALRQQPLRWHLHNGVPPGCHAHSNVLISCSALLATAAASHAPAGLILQGM